jgi:hypothetical protein
MFSSSCVRSAGRPSRDSASHEARTAFRLLRRIVVGGVPTLSGRKPNVRVCSSALRRDYERMLTEAIWSTSNRPFSSFDHSPSLNDVKGIVMVFQSAAGGGRGAGVVLRAVALVERHQQALQRWVARGQRCLVSELQPAIAAPLRLCADAPVGLPTLNHAPPPFSNTITAHRG